MTNTNINSNKNEDIYCDIHGKFSKINSADLPCCTIYVPRTRWIGSVLPPHYDNPQVVANKFPFWGLWRTQHSPPLPHVFYPHDVQPLGQCNPSFYGVENTDSMGESTPSSVLGINWALTK